MEYEGLGWTVVIGNWWYLKICRLTSWTFESLLVFLEGQCQKQISSLMPRYDLGDLRMSKVSTNKSAGQLQVDRVGRRGGPPSVTEFVFFAREDF